MGHYDDCYEEEARKVAASEMEHAKRCMKDAIKAFMKKASAQDMTDAAILLEEWKHVRAFGRLCRSFGRSS